MNNLSNFDNLTVIIPTLNEEGNIRSLIQELNIVLSGVFIIVVDDNSSDNTPRIVRNLSLIYSQILLIERKGKPCLTSSIMMGINNAKTNYVQNDTLLSSIFSYTLNFLIYHILKIEITDYTSGFIVYRRDLISNHQLVGDMGNTL